VRVLHLVDPGSPGGGGCTLRLIAEPMERLGSVEQDLLILGGRAHVELAQRCGVEPTGSIAPPLGHPAMAQRALRRTVRVLERSREPYDVIHAWTPRAAMLALMAATEHRRVAGFSVGPVTGLSMHTLMLLLEQRPMPLLASSTAVRDEYCSLGIPSRLFSVLPPAVNLDSVDGGDRNEMRDRWGVDRQTFVVGLLSEPVNWADAQIAINTLTRVQATGRNVRLLVHDSATHRVEAERWAAGVGMRDLLVVDDDVAEPWRVVRGLDAALLIGGELNTMDLSGAGSPFALLTGGGRRLRPMPGIMPLLWAMAAGVPVIAEASDAVRDVITDGVSGLLVSQGDINAAADRLLRLYDDSTIAGRIGMNARARVNERHHVSAFCVRLKDVYERLIEGRTVRVVSDENDPVVEHFERRSTAWKEVGVAAEA
jgi:hypothetical protein